MWRNALTLLATACGLSGAALPPTGSGLGGAIVDYCISSRWGVTCFIPGHAGLAGAPRGPLPLPLTLASRGVMYSAYAYLGCAIISELKHLDGDTLVRCNNLHAALRLKAPTPPPRKGRWKRLWL